MALHLRAAGAPFEPRHAPGAPAAAPRVFDDDQISRQLLEAAERSLGKATKMSTLISPLGRRHCRLKLPAAHSADIGSVQLASRNLPGVLALAELYRCPKCHQWHVNVATGFVLAESGAAVTCYHVLDRPEGELMVALTGAGRIADVVEVLAADPVADVAIVRLAGSGFQPLALSGDAPQGAPIRVISHPDEHFFALTEGVVSRYQVMHRKNQPPLTLMSITADFARGSSGGPAFNEAGDVAGVVQSTTQVYYTTDETRKEDLQMVVKQCVPARYVLGLIERE